MTNLNQEESPSVSDIQIYFFSEDTAFELTNSNAVVRWIKEVLLVEQKQLNQVNYIFCSDEYLLGINVAYLNHDTFTDIITFPYHSTPESAIEGDIFISIDRVRENAKTFGNPFDDELLRVIIHGILHLCGYKDKTPEDAKLMREKENSSLELFEK